VIPFAPAPVSDAPWHRRFAAAVRHPIRWLDELVGDGPVLALLVLTGLNAVDELSRTSFAVLAPTVADHFGVGLAGVTIPFVLAFAAAFALAIPIASMADRRNRVRLALFGGLVFSVATSLVGVSPNIWFFVAAMCSLVDCRSL
jgi:MFS family permease